MPLMLAISKMTYMPAKFLEENGVPQMADKGRLQVNKDADITIFCGDFMELDGVRCDAHYDRGALVALTADLRPGYAAKVRSLLTDDAEQLVITLGYDQSIANGPPFSISQEEVLQYWSGLECVDRYDDTPNAPPKFLDAGLTEIIETVWRSAGNPV